MTLTRLAWENHLELNKHFLSIKSLIPWSSLTLLAYKYYKIDIFYSIENINNKSVIFIFGKFHQNTNNKKYATLISKDHYFPFFPISEEEIDIKIIQDYWKEHFESINQPFPNLIWGVPENKYHLLNKHFPNNNVTIKNNNYIYLYESFKNFAGKKLQKKRNFLNHFNKNYINKVTVETIQPNHFESIINFASSFPQSSPYSKYLIDEFNFIKDFLKNWDANYMSGIVIQDKNTKEIIGFLIGIQKNQNTFETFFEKVNYNWKSILPFLISEFAKTYKKPVIYIDRQDDMGQENIIKSKKSFYPTKIIKLCIFFITNL